MSGPRLTGPIGKLARSISTTAVSASVPKSTTLLTSSKTAVPLSRKYAALLEERNVDSDQARNLYTRTSNRPHPPPRRMRLMQTFTSSTSRPAQADRSTIDFAVLPTESFASPATDPYGYVRVPILPDNYNAHNAPEAPEEPVTLPEISVMAADEATLVSALSEVEGMGVDNVELKFDDITAKDTPVLQDLWKGLVDDVLGQGQNRGKLTI